MRLSFIDIMSVIRPDACEPHANTSVDAAPIATHPSVKFALAIPKRLLELPETERDTESTPQIELKEVDDIYAEPNYHVEWLTEDALAEARTARIRNPDLVKVVPPKAHEHPEPKSLCRPSISKGHGRSSRLKTSWNVEDLRDEERKFSAAI